MLVSQTGSAKIEGDGVSDIEANLNDGFGNGLLAAIAVGDVSTDTPGFARGSEFGWWFGELPAIHQQLAIGG